VKREEFAPIVPSLSPRALAELPAAAPLRGPAAGLPLVVAPSLRSLDGRPARSALLQELPDPISGFSWTGWVELHPTTAATFGVSTGDVVAVEGPGGRVELPVFASRTVRAGLAAVPVSAALGLLEGAGGIGLGARVSIRPTGGKYKRPHVEESGTQHGRELARSVSRSAPRLPIAPQLPTMYPPTEHPHHRWGLAIDLDRCNGCSACTAACYVENNIPIVGADQVARGRSMSWLPIQAFVEDPPAPPAGEHPVVPGAPEVSLLPLPCQHCSAAPCEAVCPTFATYHSPEGLNTQIYARCIGTRYCENNCPYGVRRFNFYDVDRPPPSHLGQNPDVTIRGRGVTEKCSLCVQRIRGAEEQAMAEGRRVLVDGVERMEPRPLRDGEFQSACAAACPTQAIVFGDLKDPASRVSRLAADGRAYRLLEQLNTQPGVVYLARRRGGAT
jgi:molybdopterin-containing oxidoreductase family iron-sulfur binding subunit